MKVTEHITALQGAGERLATAASSAGLDHPVPTCPEWLVRDLLRHISGVHRWATSFVATGRERMSTVVEDADYFATVPDSELPSWYRDGLSSLLVALSNAQADLRCWTFLDAPSPLAFWARRQSHETAIHCADAEASAGTSSRFDCQFAADGIDELLGCFFTRPGGASLLTHRWRSGSEPPTPIRPGRSGSRPDDGWLAPASPTATASCPARPATFTCSCGTEGIRARRSESMATLPCGTPCGTCGTPPPPSNGADPEIPGCRISGQVPGQGYFPVLPCPLGGCPLGG